MFFITGVSEGLLRNRVKWNEKGKTLFGSEGKPTLSKQGEVLINKYHRINVQSQI